MKTLIRIVCFLGIIVLVVIVAAVAMDFKISIRSKDFSFGLGIYSVLAVDTVAVTVTPKLVSVTISTDGTVPYGTLALSGQSTTIDISDTQVADNNGSVTANFNISTTTAIGGTTWTLITATGSSDQFIHRFSTDGGSNWITFTSTSYYDFAYDVPSSGTDTRSIDLFIGMPSAVSDYGLKNITITLQAVE